MKVFIVGGTGRIGSKTINYLLTSPQVLEIRMMVRNQSTVSESFRNYDKRVQLLEGNVLNLSQGEVTNFIQGCDAIICTVGHNGVVAGIFGRPRFLVRDTVKKLCDTALSLNTASPIKFILLNSAGVDNPDGSDGQRHAVESWLLWAIKSSVHSLYDNEKAAQYLSRDISQSKESFQWTIVRPHVFLDKPKSDYSLNVSGNGTLLNSSLSSSMENIAHSLAALVLDDEIWSEWKYKMPVVSDSK